MMKNTLNTFLLATALIVASVSAPIANAATLSHNLPIEEAVPSQWASVELFGVHAGSMFNNPETRSITNFQSSH